jgi:hypothetical protein
MISIDPMPDLLYTDGNSFSLWQNTKLAGTVLIPMADLESQMLWKPGTLGKTLQGLLA